jgi:nucleoside-diphosphate kinase
MLKPEAISRGLIGEILKRIEKGGFKILALKLLKPTLKQAEKLYEMHVGKSFYHELVDHITSGLVLPLVVEGEDAIKKIRSLIGATNPAQAETGTIRRDFGLSVTKNVIHAADSPENAKRETSIFFTAGEILD